MQVTNISGSDPSVCGLDVGFNMISVDLDDEQGLAAVVYTQSKYGFLAILCTQDILTITDLI
jgi:hypothetical protein